MRGIGSVSTNVGLGLTILMLMLTGCSTGNSTDSVRTLPIQQSWELKLGDDVAGHRIAGSLGDVSIELNGGSVYAPFDGKVEPNDVAGCVIYSSPEVPAYTFRFCGLHSIRYGDVKQGDGLGKGTMLQFAALRRQPDGTWALVEPAKEIIERSLTPP